MHDLATADLRAWIIDCRAHLPDPCVELNNSCHRYHVRVETIRVGREEKDALSSVEQRNAGKRFRQLLASKPLGGLEEWTTSDNEWRYRKT